MGLALYKETCAWLDVQANLIPLKDEFCEDECGLWLSHSWGCDKALEQYAFVPHRDIPFLYQKLTSLSHELKMHFEPEPGKESTECSGDDGACEYLLAMQDLKDSVYRMGKIWVVDTDVPRL